MNRPRVGVTRLVFLLLMGGAGQSNYVAAKAGIDAFTEAVALINKDKKWAAQVYLDVSADKKSTLGEIQKQLEDVNIQFTTTPKNVQKYAEFMFDAGYIKTKPASWKDLYFPEIHDQPGS